MLPERSEPLTPGVLTSHPCRGLRAVRVAELDPDAHQCQSGRSPQATCPWALPAASDFAGANPKTLEKQKQIHQSEGPPSSSLFPVYEHGAQR